MTGGVLRQISVRARTLTGAVAKLRIARLVIGCGDKDHDDDLAAFETPPGAWFDSAFADLERLAGDAS